MTVNFQQVQQRIKLIGQIAPAEQILIANRLELALHLLAENAHDLEELDALRERDKS